MNTAAESSRAKAPDSRRPTRSYSRRYFNEIAQASLASAEEIVPLVTKLVQPTSVIDVGCGVGAWLSVFKRCGVEVVRGIDGDYIDPTDLLIPTEWFTPANLEEPFRLPRNFDLIVSLEVAEHLAPESAKGFVDSLTRLGDVVLFSAAIPHQGGTHHLNEQWPDYWARYFRDAGYQVIDCIRRRFWDNPRVEWYYAQNMFFYATREAVERLPLLKRELERPCTYPLSLVHPRKYLEACTLENAPARKLLRALLYAIKRAIRRRTSHLFSRRSSNLPA